MTNGENTQLPAAPSPGLAASSAEKRDQAERTLSELLVLMGVQARLDLKDAADGGISVAIFPEGEIPGAPAGRRSPVLESLQFLLNKLVNRPGAERRWLSVGIGAHAEPRPPRGPKPVPQAAAPAPAAGQPARPRSEPRPPAPPAPERRSAEPDEHALQVPEDAALRAAIRRLAEKSAARGRFYAVVGMKPEQRAEALRGAEGVEGVSLKVEGEGRSRRLVFVPDKPSPMPKRTLPAEDEEDED